jgi:hypothetical protein
VKETSHYKALSLEIPLSHEALGAPEKAPPSNIKNEHCTCIKYFFTTEPTESTEEKPQCGFSMGRVKEH